MGDVVDLGTWRTRKQRAQHPAGSALPDAWYFEAVGYRPGLWRVGGGQVGHVVMDRGNGQVETRCYRLYAITEVNRATDAHRPCKSCVPT